MHAAEPIRLVRQGIAAVVAVALVAAVAVGVGNRADGATTDEDRRWVIHVTRDLVGHHPGAEQEQVWTTWLGEGWPRLELTRRHVDHPHWNGIVVAELFSAILDRPVDPDASTYWTRRLLTDLTPATLAIELAASPESLGRGDGTPADTVTVLYEALLGRPPDGTGLSHFGAVLRAGTSPQFVAAALRSSPEARGHRVDSLYRRLLGRSADPAGRTHWVGRLAHLDERELAAQLAASDEYFRRAIASDAPPSVPEPDVGPGGSTTTSSATTAPSASTSTTSTTTTSTTTTSTSTTTTTVPTTPEAEHFTGPVEAFYVVPDPLPAAPPGTLIRYQDVSRSADWVTRRIMYHSRDAEDRDRAVTGTITFPTDAPPPSGWPVVSFAHGTTGIASQCAPSRGAGEAPRYGVHGVGVATDYIGLGPVGEIHPYLSSAAEGHAVIDAVRAAGQVPGSSAGTEWFSVGGSQGGHAALVAGERNASYSPELTLLGTAALAPPAAFDQTFGAVDEIVTHIIGVMVIYGMPGEHPVIDPHDYVGQEVADDFHVLEDSCLPDIISTFAAQDHGNFWTNDPRETEPARSFFLENEPGLVVTPAAMYIASGTADIQVPLGRVHVLMDRLCAMGQVVEYREFDGADHGAVFSLADADVRRFLADRLAGEPAVDSCPWR